jgi:hypothetical protein
MSFLLLQESLESCNYSRICSFFFFIMVSILQISIVMKPLQCNTLYICWTCNLYTYKLYLHRRMWALLLKRINLGPHIVQLIDPSDHAKINDTCANHTSSPCIIMSPALQLSSSSWLYILRFSSWHDSSGYIVLEVCWRGRNYRQRIAMRQLHLMFKDSIGTEQLHESQKEVRDLNEKCPKVLRSATYLVASTASLSSS